MIVGGEFMENRIRPEITEEKVEQILQVIRETPDGTGHGYQNIYVSYGTGRLQTEI